MLCALMLRYDASERRIYGAERMPPRAFHGRLRNRARRGRARTCRMGKSRRPMTPNAEIDGYRTGIGRRAGDAAASTMTKRMGFTKTPSPFHRPRPGRTSLRCDVHPKTCNRCSSPPFPPTSPRAFGQPEMQSVYVLVPITLAAVINTARTRDELGRFFSFTDERESSI